MSIIVGLICSKFTLDVLINRLYWHNDAMPFVDRLRAMVALAIVDARSKTPKSIADRSLASRTRPGLEAMRDLAAQGQIEAALVYAPDRLSRKYAYQVLLGEEFARGGVSFVFFRQGPFQSRCRSHFQISMNG